LIVAFVFAFVLAGGMVVAGPPPSTTSVPVLDWCEVCFKAESEWLCYLKGCGWLF
jgi:hypothetical protein